MIVTKKAHPAADRSARPRARARAAAARQHGAGARRRARRGGHAGRSASAWSTCRTARHDGAGRRRPRAPAASSRRFSSRSRQFRDRTSSSAAWTTRKRRAPGETGARPRRRPFMTGVHRSDPRAPTSCRRLDGSDRRASARPGDAAALAGAALEDRDAAACDIGLQLRLHQHDLLAQADDAAADGEQSARVVFERLFGDSGTTDSAARAARLREQTQHPRFGAGETGALENSARRGRPRRARRISGIDPRRRAPDPEGREPERASCRSSMRPAGVPATFDEHAKLMFDLQVLAYPGRPDARHHVHDGPSELSGRAYPEIGVSDGTTRCRIMATRPRRSRRLAKVNVTHVDVGVLPGEAAGDARRRRLAARPHAAPLRQRDDDGNPNKHDPKNARSSSSGRIS